MAAEKSLFSAILSLLQTGFAAPEILLPVVAATGNVRPQTINRRVVTIILIQCLCLFMKNVWTANVISLIITARRGRYCGLFSERAYIMPSKALSPLKRYLQVVLTPSDVVSRVEVANGTGFHQLPVVDHITRLLPARSI